MSLYIYVSNNNLRHEMEQHVSQRRLTDSGLDLLSLETILDFSQQRHGVEMKLGMHFAALSESGNPVPYLLLPRSSMSLTPLRLSNSVGLADAGYRGELIARVDCVSNDMMYPIHHGRRLFQVVQHNWLPWKEVIFVNSLADLPAAPDNRGAGGFGSTGN